MATVPPLPLSLNAARATFGQGPGSLLAMRRGAGIVPDIPPNAGVPSGSPIALSQLVGATTVPPATVYMQDAAAGDNSFGGTAEAFLQFSGILVQDHNVSTRYTWCLDGFPGLYQARWTPISGAPTGAGSAAINTWVALGGGGPVRWRLIRSVDGTVRCSGLVEVRRASDGAVLASATWSLEATRNSGP